MSAAEFNPVLAVLRIRDALQGVDGYELETEIADCEALLCFLYTTRPPEPMSPEERKRASKAARQAKWRAKKASTDASSVDADVDTEASTERLHAESVTPSRASESSSEISESSYALRSLSDSEKEKKKEKSAMRLQGASTASSTRSPPTAATWAAYATAYRARYGADPLRNAAVNGQLARLLRRVPGDEAPHIAQHYVSSSNARYVAAGHTVGCLLQDAEKLRTEWLTGRSITAHEARATDRTSGRAQQYEQTFAQLRAEDRKATHG